jgi:hypothetical protein
MEQPQMTAAPEPSEDAEAASLMSVSWKDEYLTLVLSIPLFVAFLGRWGHQTALNGFTALAAAPEWYQLSFLTAVAASFGLRLISRTLPFRRKA